jgi:pimeloyl-ACP methyl ester carboxylesterase
VHQIIGALRGGRYAARVGSRARPPAFAKIAVAGYSVGGLVAEVEAASFADAQALLVISWAEQGFTSYGVSIPYVIAHCQPGAPKPPSGLKGYFRTLTPEKVPRLVSPQADPRIKSTFAANEELDPCGQFTNGSQWYAGLNRTALARIKVPMLLIYGNYDVLYNSDAWPAQWAHFTGTHDRTLVGIPDGQMLMLDKHAALTRGVVSSWLDNHGF